MQTQSLVFESEAARNDIKAVLEILRPLFDSPSLKNKNPKGYNACKAFNVALKLIEQTPVAEGKAHSRIRPTRVGYLSLVD